MNNLNVAKVFDIEIESENCCDLCNEIAFNLIMQCPICRTGNSIIDIRHELTTEDKVVKCTKCDAEFKLISGDWYGTKGETKVVVIS